MNYYILVPLLLLAFYIQHKYLKYYSFRYGYMIFFSSFFITNTLLFFYFFLKPLETVFVYPFFTPEKMFLKHVTNIESMYLVAVFVALISLIFFILGYKKTNQKSRILHEIIISSSKIKSPMWLLLIFAPLLSFYDPFGIMGVIASSLGIYKFSNLGLLAFIGLAYLSYKSKNITIIMFFIILISLFNYYFNFHSERRDVIRLLYLTFVLCFILFSHHKHVTNIKFNIFTIKNICLVIITGVILLYFAIFTRLHSVLTDKGVDLLDIILLNNIFSLEFKQLHYWFTHNIDYPIIFNDFAYCINQVPEKVDFLYGKSFFKIFLTLIPRTIFPGKPLPFFSEYVIHFDYNYFQAGGSRSPGIIGLLYWNFWLPGVIIFSYLFGILSKKIDYVLYKAVKTNNNVAIMIFALINSYLIVIMRGDLDNGIVQLTFEVLIIVIMINTFNSIILLTKKYKYLNPT